MIGDKAYVIGTWQRAGGTVTPVMVCIALDEISAKQMAELLGRMEVVQDRRIGEDAPFPLDWVPATPDDERHVYMRLDDKEGVSWYQELPTRLTSESLTEVLGPHRPRESL